MKLAIIEAVDAAEDQTPVRWWASEDKQNEIEVAGTAAEALAELLDQCADEEQRANILAGSFQVAETLTQGVLVQVRDELQAGQRDRVTRAGVLEALGNPWSAPQHDRYWRGDGEPKVNVMHKALVFWNEANPDEPIRLVLG